MVHDKYSNMEIKLTRKISQTGDSLIFVIPKDIVDIYDLRKGDLIEVTLHRVIRVNDVGE